MQRRIAERRRNAGRWMGSSASGSTLQPALPSQEQSQPPPPQGPAPAGPDLGGFIRGGLQRKVARFAEMANSLRREQDARGAGGASWGRQEQLGAAAAPASSAGTPAPASSNWEQALNVTRVQRPRGGQQAGWPGSDAAAPQPVQRQQGQQGQQRWEQEERLQPPQQCGGQQGQGLQQPGRLGGQQQPEKWEGQQTQVEQSQPQPKPQPWGQGSWQQQVPMGPASGAQRPPVPPVDDGGLDW